MHPYAALTPEVVLDALSALGLRPDGRLLALSSYENRVYQVWMEEGAPVVADSWRDRTLHEYESVDTFAEGLATRIAFDYPARIIWDRIDGFTLVSDDEMRAAMLALMESAWIVAEGAGAAATAAAIKMRADLQGKSVCCVVSGGNVPLSGLRDALAKGMASGATS